MCTVVAKYFPKEGWTVVKNRDQNYLPTVTFKDKDIGKLGEILVVYDKSTNYNEGMNQAGITIVTATLAPLSKLEFDGADGARIYDALMKDSVEDAAKLLKSRKMTGYTFIFDKDNFILIEGARVNGTGDYHSTMRKVAKDEIVVRTNYGTDFPWAGYIMGQTDKMDKQRLSSESRRGFIEKAAPKAKNPRELLNLMSAKYTDDLQLNPFRVATEDRQMRTILQCLLIPKNLAFYIVPVQTKLEVKTDREYVHAYILPNDHIQVTYGSKIKDFIKSKTAIKATGSTDVTTFKGFIKKDLK